MRDSHRGLQDSLFHDRHKDQDYFVDLLVDFLSCLSEQACCL